MMKKGIVIPKRLSHKNGVSKLKAGEVVTENDVNNFDELVEMGCITDVEGTEDDQESDLMKLKKNELQEKCNDLEIEFTESDNKAELVALIEEAVKSE